MKKLLLFIFVPFILNAMNDGQSKSAAPVALNVMDSQSQEASSTYGQLGRPEYRSSLTLNTFDSPITAEQKDLLEKILTFKHVYHNDVTSTNCFMIPLILGTTTLCLGFMMFSLMKLVGRNQEEKEAGFIVCGGLMTIAAAFASIPGALWIKAACKNSKAVKIFQQYIKDGLALGLGNNADALAKLLEDGFKGQSLCSDQCVTCLNQRKVCDQCFQAAKTARQRETTEQKICAKCWNSVCSRCPTCKSKRENALKDYIIQHLALNVDRNDINIDTLICYLNAILKKQSDNAQTAV